MTLLSQNQADRVNLTLRRFLGDLMFTILNAQSTIPPQEQPRFNRKRLYSVLSRRRSRVVGQTTVDTSSSLEQQAMDMALRPP